MTTGQEWKTGSSSHAPSLSVSGPQISSVADEDSNDAFTLPLLHNLGVLIEGAEADVVRSLTRMHACTYLGACSGKGSGRMWCTLPPSLPLSHPLPVPLRVPFPKQPHPSQMRCTERW